MKNFIKITILISVLILAFWILNVNAAIDTSSLQWIDNIENSSINNISQTWELDEDIKNVWFWILTIIKYIISAILVLFLVYAWIQMVLSMWNDEEELSSAKRQLWYSIFWLIFINIPGSLYQIFNVENKWTIWWWINWTWSSPVSSNSDSLIINNDIFDQTINWSIIAFLEYSIFAIAVFVIVLAGIRILTSRWNDEQISEAKTKIIWSIVWLMFIGFIESWQSLVYGWKISDWANLFETLENLALFFAWPVVIFFLTLSWYYYITSAWDEEKIKKSKVMIISTLVAIVILLASHSILKDLITLNI